jgi:LuxR family maltose regulon positive regulatory protein
MSASIDECAGAGLHSESRSGPGAADFELMESKLSPPPPGRAMVARSALVGRLLATAEPVVCVIAPTGYGKTTLLSQWAEREGERVGWVSVDQGDNDPAVLLTYIAAALDRIEPIDPGIFRTLADPADALPGPAAAGARLAAAVAAMSRPVALVLDDVGLLDDPDCLAAVTQFAVRFPSGSQLLLASRTRPPLPLDLLRAQGRVLEVGTRELAMDRREAGALLEAAGVRLGESEAAELLGRTEGWPVGLYLAALALQARATQEQGAGEARFTGDDRFMADYLRSELLSKLPPSTVAFLTRSAVLERLSGPLCDAVLEVDCSTAVLRSLADEQLLLPLDRNSLWYRHHQLFREFLLAELSRREPELVRCLHARAAAWCEANDLAETALQHAQAAGDTDRAARLVTTLLQPAYTGGRVDTARQWLMWFEQRGLIQRYASVAVQGAWLEALVGQSATAERWAAAAERAEADGAFAGDGTMASYLALLRALLCRDGVERMRADAEAAVAGLASDSPWRATARLLEGIAWLLAGDSDRADPILDRAVQLGRETGAAPTAAVGLAERAIVAMGRDRWDDAGALAEQALAAVRVGHLDEYDMSLLVHAVVAEAAVHRGDTDAAREHLAVATSRRSRLTYAMPHRSVQTLLELVRAYLAVGDGAAARIALREADDILMLRPDLGILPGQADELGSRVDLISGQGAGVILLTSAELRLIPLLSTHLTFRQLGERLYLSRHTVKTQANSLYRKLGVSSRGQAVQSARRAGLGG